MLTNYHTHTTFCDGKNTVNEVVETAIKKGFNALGFSGHGYTPYDESYCIKDFDGYVKKVNEAKNKYKDKIQIYLGVEEDCFAPVNKSKLDYVIGSCHYINKDGVYYSIDGSYELYKKSLKAFDGNVLAYAEEYYSTFCDYILKRKPDIIGHFDLITKYDELENNYFSNNPEYDKIAEKYLRIALKSNCIFEVNVGAVTKGYKNPPYPAENLLNVIKRSDGKIILSADCHDAEKLDCNFTETTKFLKNIGFNSLYVLYDGKFQKTNI